MATVLTLAGLGWQTTDIMNSLYNGFAHTGGNTYHRVDYTPEFDGVFAGGVAALDAAIHDSGLASPKIIVAHSLGSEIASIWLDQYGVSQAGLASSVSFILCGNPMRKYGGRACPAWPVNGAAAGVSPAVVAPAFTVTDVARKGDGWCNWPQDSNIFNTASLDFGALATAFVGMFTTHMLYLSVDLHNLAGTHISSHVDGNTTYHLMP